MLSFTFNWGENIWRATTSPTRGAAMRSFILAGDYSVSATSAVFSVYMNPQFEAPGNIIRRGQEMNMFLYGNYDSTH